MAPGSQRQVLAGLAKLLRPGGRMVAGFATDRAYRLEDFRVDTQAIGMTVEFQFSTWQMDPLDDTSGWAVTVLRAPGTPTDAVQVLEWTPAASWPGAAVHAPPAP
jgi:hypothetical protein